MQVLMVSLSEGEADSEQEEISRKCPKDSSSCEETVNFSPGACSAFNSNPEVNFEVAGHSESSGQDEECECETGEEEVEREDRLSVRGIPHVDDCSSCSKQNLRYLIARQ